MKTILQFCIFLLLLNVGFLKAQTVDTIRVCMWNLKLYDSEETQNRNESIEKFIRDAKPDILVVLGLKNFQNAFGKFTSEIIYTLDANYKPDTSSVIFPNAYTIENRIFYNASKVTLLHSSIGNGGPESILCDFVTNISTDTFSVFGISLSMNDEETRGAIASNSRVFLLDRKIKKTIITGAFYPDGPNDAGYRIFVPPTVTNNTLAYDPLSRNWAQDSSQFTAIYTNSTRGDDESGCDTALGKGLKYRYDYILNRRELLENYIPNSYTVFGNDGLDRRNSSITNPPNQIVSQEIAEALQCASSHLPVYADYVFGKVTSVENSHASDFSLNFYPNPLQESSTISCSLPADGVLKITLHDMLGREVAILHDAFKSAGSYTFPFKAENLADGFYFLKMSAGGKNLTKSVSIVR